MQRFHFHAWTGLSAHSTTVVDMLRCHYEGEHVSSEGWFTVHYAIDADSLETAALRAYNWLGRVNRFPTFVHCTSTEELR